MSTHIHRRTLLLVALAALALGVVALTGAPGASASVPAFTIVNLGGDPSIPDVHGAGGVTYDVSSITGTGSEMVVVGIPGAASAWRLTAPNTGTVTIAGYSPVTFSGTPSLFGGDGDDTFAFAGGTVSGTITGGLGANVLDYSASGTGIMVNLATGTATGTAGISGIQNAIGGAGNDTLTGDGENNSFTGGPGRDMMNGSAGLDTLVETRNADFTLTNTSLTIGSEGNDTLAGIEAARLTGGTGGNLMNASTFMGSAVLDGDGGNDTLRSGSGNDLLIGGAGIDSMAGGAGDDEYRGGPGANTIIEAGSGGTDTVAESCDGDFALTDTGLVWSDGSDNAGSGLPYIEAFRLTGGAGDNDFAIAALPRTTVQVDGGEGSDALALDPHGAAVQLITGGINVPSLPSSATYTGIEAVTVVDGTAPVLDLPGPMTVEATSADGAVVDFTVTADDAVFGPVAVTCTPACGSTFPLGATEVYCQASDGVGNTVMGSFLLTVVDTTAPVLTLPDDITVRATSAAGAVVDFAATAEDAVGGTLSVDCTPAAGSTFPVGSTTVDCTASDAAGNAVSGSFTVTVTSALSWTGFLQPINADGSSVFKLKSTVPVKFALTGDSAGITDLIARFSCAKVSNGIVGDDVEVTSSSAATTGNVFRYDLASGQYIFNWGTQGLSIGTYQIRVDLGDGLSHTVLVSLK